MQETVLPFRKKNNSVPFVSLPMVLSWRLSVLLFGGFSFAFVILICGSLEELIPNCQHQERQVFSPYFVALAMEVKSYLIVYIIC